LIPFHRTHTYNTVIQKKTSTLGDNKIKIEFSTYTEPELKFFFSSSTIRRVVLCSTP